jgi:acyl carrier protein
MVELDFRELQELAAEILGVEPEQVQMNVSFQRDLAADSLDLVELIAAVEDKYDVELPEEELENMKNIGDLWQFLEAPWRSRQLLASAPTPCRCAPSGPRAGRWRSPAWASTRPRRCSPTRTWSG